MLKKIIFNGFSELYWQIQWILLYNSISEKLDLTIISENVEWWKFHINELWSYIYDPKKDIISIIYKTSQYIFYNIILQNNIDYVQKKNVQKIKQSEWEIRDYLFNNTKLIKKITNIHNFENIAKEYVIPWYWRIDILWKSDNNFIIIELKKWKSSMNAIMQTFRYKEYFESSGFNVVAFLITNWIKNEQIELASNYDINLIDLGITVKNV